MKNKIKSDILRAKLAKKLKLNQSKLLDRALIHRSFLNEANNKTLASNERLEFLGDAVLELVISQWLFEKFPRHPEGILTNLRSNIVRTTSLARVAETLGLGPCLKMSRGEIDSGGRENPSILANTLEAVIGAIYLDQGLAKSEAFIRSHFQELFRSVVEKKEYKDAKSLLQERVQANQKLTPTYKTLKESGPDHDKTFIVGVFAASQKIAQGTGKSKQAAEEQAAKNALNKLQ